MYNKKNMVDAAKDSIRKIRGKNMNVKVLGVSKVSFTGKDGNRVEGHRLYVCYEANKVVGFKTDDFFVNKEVKLPELNVEDEIQLFFNPRGKVEAVIK